MVQTDIQKRHDGLFNVWGLLKDSLLFKDESLKIKNDDGSFYEPRTWTILGVGDDFNEAKRISKQYRYSNI